MTTGGCKRRLDEIIGQVNQTLQGWKNTFDYGFHAKRSVHLTGMCKFGSGVFSGTVVNATAGPFVKVKAFTPGSSDGG
jgi:hypothetical protein